MFKKKYDANDVIVENVFNHLLRISNTIYENDDKIIEESIKDKILKTMSAVILAGTILGVPAVSYLKAKNNRNHNNRNVNISAVQKIINDNNNASPEILSRLKNGLNLAKMYNSFNNNVYLKSVFITYLFSQNKVSYGNLGIEGKRTSKISYSQRYKLFYKHVLGKELNDDISFDQIKKECQEHNSFKQYSEMIKQIKEKAGTNNITFWLTEELADELGVSGDEVYWCGIFAGSVVGDTSGNFTSTIKFSKSMNSAAYYYEGNNELKKNKNKIISTFIKPGDVLTLEGYKAETNYGGHFAIVYKVEKDNNDNVTNIITLEGNTGKDEVSLNRRSVEEIKIATSLLNNTESNVKIVNDINDQL